MFETLLKRTLRIASLLVVAFGATSLEAGAGCAKVSEYYAAPIPSLGVATLGPLNIMEAILPSGAPAGMSIMDCDENGSMDLSIGWSQTTTSPAEIDMSLACGGDRLPFLVLVSIVTDNAVIHAVDKTGAIVDTAAAGPVYVAQELIVSSPGGIAHVLIEGTQMCLTGVCWQCPDAAASPSFSRGDSNQDGGVDMSDAIHTLDYLFTGGSEPTCLDAADSNGDGQLDISDPTSTLNFLFLGGPPPSGGLGCVPHGSQAALGCREAACSA